MQELRGKPLFRSCPFCKKLEPVRFYYASEDDDGGDSEDVQVVCAFNNGGCGSSSGYRKTEEEALKLWNSAERPAEQQSNE